MSAKSTALTPSYALSFGPRSNQPKWTTTACIFAADLLTLSAVFAIVILARHLLTPAYQLASYLNLFPFLLMLLAAFSIQGLYPGVLVHPAEEIRRVFLSITTVFLVMASTTFLWHNAESYSRSVLLVIWAACSPTVLLTRYLVRQRFRTKPWWGVQAVVLGSGSSARRVIRKLQKGTLGVKVVGVLCNEQILSWEHDLPPLLGTIAEAPAFADSGLAQYAIIAMPQKSNLELQQAIQDHCRGFRHVLLVLDMAGLCSLGLCAREIGGEIGFELPQRLFQRGAAVTKRFIDVSLTLLCLFLTLPLLLLIAAAIKMTSHGPILYRQNRCGRKGETFKALKFRTMIPNADEMLKVHLAKYPEHRLEWQRDHKLRHDPRITFVGKWLRRLSLDELPQLLNVLAGQMSLVGPRPIVEAEIGKYGRRYGLYTRVRPGITGLWQVSGRNNTTYDERVKLDEYYVHNWSVWLDIYILIRTTKAVCTAEGAY